MSKNLDLSKLPQTLLVADYSSLEIGIQGDFSQRLFGDGQILQMYEDQKKKKLGGKELDIHSLNAKSVFGKWLEWEIPEYVIADKKKIECPYAGERADGIPTEEFKKHPFGSVLRDLIKAIWYGLAYGKSAYGFATLVGADGKMIGEKTADKMVNALLDAVPAMRAWFKWVEEFVREYHGIYSLGGRWCDLAREMESDNEWEHRRAFRRAYNFPMQATGAEIIGDAMVKIWRDKELRELGYRVCLQVHDELVLRGPLEFIARATEIVVGHMTSATANGTALLVPLQVGTNHGPNYFEASK